MSETGIFESVVDGLPAAGVVPYQINAEQWSDGAVSQRWVGVPGRGTIHLYENAKSIPGSMFGRKLEFPQDGVLVKTLSVATDRSDPPNWRAASKRRCRISMVGTGRRLYLRVERRAPDALLPMAEGIIVFARWPTRVTRWGQAAGSSATRHAWKCPRCHNPWSDYALAFNVAQLNRQRGILDVNVNQLRTFRGTSAFG